MKFIRRFADRLRVMSRPAHLILKYSLIVSCLYLIGAAAVLVYAGEFTARTCELHLLARSLYTTPQSILLIATLASAIVEERAVK